MEHKEERRQGAKEGAGFPFRVPEVKPDLFVCQITRFASFRSR